MARRRVHNRVLSVGALILSLLLFTASVTNNLHATWVRVGGSVVLAVTIVVGLAVRFASPHTPKS